jgi:hypothetical protein
MNKILFHAVMKHKLFDSRSLTTSWMMDGRKKWHMMGYNMGYNIWFAILVVASTMQQPSSIALLAPWCCSISQRGFSLLLRFACIAIVSRVRVACCYMSLWCHIHGAIGATISKNFMRGLIRRKHPFINSGLGSSDDFLSLFWIDNIAQTISRSFHAHRCSDNTVNRRRL